MRHNRNVSSVEAWELVLDQARQKNLANWTKTDVQKALSWALLSPTGTEARTDCGFETRLDALLTAWLEENPRWQPEFLERLFDALCGLEETIREPRHVAEEVATNSLHEIIWGKCVQRLSNRLKNVSLLRQTNLMTKTLGIE
jgi:hypothetical protein